MPAISISSSLDSNDNRSPEPQPNPQPRLSRTRSGTRAAAEKHGRDADEGPSAANDAHKSKKARKSRENERERDKSKSKSKSRKDKKSKSVKGPDLDDYTKKARGIPRITDPFPIVDHALLVGKASMSGGKPARKLIKAMEMSEEIQEQYAQVYKAIVRLIPSVVKVLKETKAEDLENAPFVKAIELGISRVRSDDAKSLKGSAGLYAASDPSNPINLGPPSGSKQNRGFNHAILARLLCPASYSAEYDKDPEGTRQKLLAGEIKVTAKRLPLFAYEDCIYDPNDIAKGAFKGHLVLRTIRDIYTGPSTALEGPSGAASSARAPVSTICGITEVIPEMVGYAMMHAFYSIMARSSFKQRDGAFSYPAFYHMIVRMFRGNPHWAKETLEWLNLKVFGHKNGLPGVGRGGDAADEDDDNEESEDVIMKKQYDAKFALELPGFEGNMSDERDTDDTAQAPADLNTNGIAGPSGTTRTPSPPPYRNPRDPSMSPLTPPAESGAALNSSTMASPTPASGDDHHEPPVTKRLRKRAVPAPIDGSDAEDPVPVKRVRRSRK